VDWLVVSCFNDFDFFLDLPVVPARFVLLAISALLLSTRPLLVTRERSPLCVSFIDDPLLDDFVFALCVFTTPNQQSI